MRRTPILALTCHQKTHVSLKNRAPYNWETTVIPYFVLSAIRSQVENKDSLFTQEIRTEDFSKDTANPLSHQVMASSNFFSSTQTVAPVGNMMFSLVPKKRNRDQNWYWLATNILWIHTCWVKTVFYNLKQQSYSPLTIALRNVGCNLVAASASLSESW